MPYQYQGAAADVLRGLTQAAKARNDFELQKGDDELANKKREFAQQYALQGMRNQVDQRQQANQLQLTRLQGLYGSVGNLLQGLYS